MWSIFRASSGPLATPGIVVFTWDPSVVSIYTEPTGGTALAEFIKPFSGFNGTNLYVEGIAPGSNTLSWSYSGQSDCVDTIRATVIKVDTETIAAVPSDRTRKKVGVGEQVTLTLQPTSLTPVSWSISGNGTFSATTGNPVTFTAHDRASTPAITATYGGGACSVNFNVVEPDGVAMEQELGTGVWHINGTASAGFKGRAYITPHDVSFINIEIREQTCTGVGTGFYSDLNGIVHPLGSWGPVIAGTAAKPSKDSFVDTVQSGSKGPPFSVGSFTWPIPWEFRVGGGNAKAFTTVTHQQDADVAVKVTISKGGTSVSKNASDPTSAY